MPMNVVKEVSLAARIVCSRLCFYSASAHFLIVPMPGESRRRCVSPAPEATCRMKGRSSSMLPRLMQRPLALAAGAAALLVSAVTSAATVSQQIIVDQFGWRANAPRKVVIFADPVSGQNSAVAYTPGTSFQVRRASDNATVFTGTITSWKSGTTHTQSGDKVWYGDFSSYTTPGTYYVYDPTNNLQSYNFRL